MAAAFARHGGLVHDAGALHVVCLVLACTVGICMR
jgi:hypothetical protein